jgi:hypothetical protein
MNVLHTRIFRIASAVATALVVGACATPAPVPAQTQPSLGKVAQPFADEMLRAGISSVTVYGNGARVRMATRMGEVYFRYPAGLAPTAFALYVDASGVEVDSDTFDASNAAQYEAALKAILPQAVQRANANNTQQMQQRLGGGGR